MVHLNAVDTRHHGHCDCGDLCNGCEARALSVCGSLEDEAFTGLQKLNHSINFPARSVLFNQETPVRDRKSVV